MKKQNNHRSQLREVSAPPAAIAKNTSAAASTASPHLNKISEHLPHTSSSELSLVPRLRSDERNNKIIHIDPDLHKALKLFAANQDRTIQQIAEFAISQYINFSSNRSDK